jgi:hypothetical protein
MNHPRFAFLLNIIHLFSSTPTHPPPSPSPLEGCFGNKIEESSHNYEQNFPINELCGGIRSPDLEFYHLLLYKEMDYYCNLQN